MCRWLLTVVNVSFWEGKLQNIQAPIRSIRGIPKSVLLSRGVLEERVDLPLKLNFG